METKKIHVVTGAFGYSGKYIVRRLIEKDLKVRTLTNSTWKENSFLGKIDVRPLNCNNTPELEASMEDVKVFYNTYWVRFNHKGFSHSQAVENTLKLFEAAVNSGVERIVHISITNPSLESHLEYFHGKAILENALKESGLSYAIIRPAVLFGKEDILINNIAWMIRKFPMFGVFGKGDYRLQPIYVDDLAKIMVEQGMSRINCTIDAIGPETFTYRELVETLMECIGKKRRIFSMSPGIGYCLGKMISLIKHDVTITKPEIEGLMSNLLCTNSQPSGTTALSSWAKQNRDILGVTYANELRKRVKG